MDRRFGIALLSLCFWPALLTLLAERLYDYAERVGQALGQAALLAPPQRVTPKLDLPPPEEFEVPEEQVELALPAPSGTKTKPRRRGLRVREATILELARARAIPSAVGTPAQGLRPAGLRFVDVEGLGVGLKNGDVLTRVAGVPALNRGAVVGAVIAAREAKAPAIHAEFWRDGTPWQLVVEMPYLPEPATSSRKAPAPAPTP